MLRAALDYPALGLIIVIRFFDAFKPSEPHLVPYLVQVKGFSEQQARSWFDGFLVAHRSQNEH